MNTIIKPIHSDKDYKDILMERKAKMSLVEKDFGFRNVGLEFLLKRYNVKLSDFIKDTYSKKETKNKTVQISKLINKPKDAPKYFTVLDFANDLAHWFNKKRVNGDQVIAPSYFIGNLAKIQIVGAIYTNSQIGMFLKKEVKTARVHPRYADCVGIISKIPCYNGQIQLFRQRNEVYTGADGRWGVCQDKKSKIVWHGFIEPNSNGKYDVVDKSFATGKTISVLASNIDLKWSSRTELAYYPTYWEY
tara:strand:- start:341 stop:1081 length:741 start_codon:yes stop_codon:yes gene_type:complete